MLFRSYEQTASVEAYADVRFKGQSYELKVCVDRPSLQRIMELFLEAYRQAYGQIPTARAIEIVTLRVRRIGKHADLALPEVDVGQSGRQSESTRLCDSSGTVREVPIVSRGDLLRSAATRGPILLLDPTATAFVPEQWNVSATRNGSVLLRRVFAPFVARATSP